VWRDIGKEGKSFFLNIKGPELLNKYAYVILTSVNLLCCACSSTPWRSGSGARRRLRKLPG
jgi:hypothetical protein